MIGQVFWTVLSGVTVFALGQIFVKFVIDPIQDFYKLTGEIGHSLIYYANVYSNMDVCDESTRKEAHETFRKHASELFMRTHMIPLYGLWAKLHLLPSRKNVNDANSSLIGLSNGCLVTSGSDRSYESNRTRRTYIEKMLNLQTSVNEEE